MPTDATPDVVHMDRHPQSPVYYSVHSTLLAAAPPLEPRHAHRTASLSEVSCSVLTCPEWERRAHLGDDVEGQGLEHSSLVGLKQRRAAGDADGGTTKKTSIRPASLAWVALLAPGRRPERRQAWSSETYTELPGRG
ncbi:hypothetical protein CPLU01_05520 [Colletotrichum plurivorum]|uniref:Uncharacterized protein n=1 Tax=Colletotrichum plurivorum TaxID=2175906 RepID=A0A8H6KL17_9PEZI|nr:hypothetical protein CPLU01_05520 [Colletotrichum plurivorum]